MRKKILLGVIICALFLPLTIMAQKGEKNLGIMGGYNTRTESAIAGIFFQYRFSKYFRLAPDLQFLIKNNDQSSFQFNGNAQFPLALDTKFNFYPLVGLTYQSWRNSAGEESITNNRFGGNFGGGFEYLATPTLKISIEGKYSLVKSYSSGGFTLSMAYQF